MWPKKKGKKDEKRRVTRKFRAGATNVPVFINWYGMIWIWIETFHVIVLQSDGQIGCEGLQWIADYSTKVENVGEVVFCVRDATLEWQCSESEF